MCLSPYDQRNCSFFSLSRWHTPRWACCEALDSTASKHWLSDIQLYDADTKRWHRLSLATHQPWFVPNLGWGSGGGVFCRRRRSGHYWTAEQWKCIAGRHGWGNQQICVCGGACAVREWQRLVLLCFCRGYCIVAIFTFYLYFYCSEAIVLCICQGPWCMYQYYWMVQNSEIFLFVRFLSEKCLHYINGHHHFFPCYFTTCNFSEERTPVQ